jgi:IstB-like ATP binding protein
MGELKLYGMRAAYDEALATALKRKHEPQRFVGDLLRAEISEKQARSIKYQITASKLPLAKRRAGGASRSSSTPGRDTFSDKPFGRSEDPCCARRSRHVACRLKA